MCKVSKRSGTVWETTLHVRELYLVNLSVYRVHPTADGSAASSLRSHLVLGTSFSHQAPNPMIPYGRPGRVAKLVTMLVVRARTHN